jgi:hypothetical protein
VQEIYYAISASNVWDPTYVYDCPAGYHWASTDEALQWVLPPASNPNAQVNGEYFKRRERASRIWKAL